MNKLLGLALLLAISIGGCANSQSPAPEDSMIVVNANPGSGANAFNPYVNQKLPNLRSGTTEGNQMLGALGARGQTIEGEAAHRANWKEELYPIVFGDAKAPGEIIALLDFSNPESEKIWSQVQTASKSLSPSQCKIVVYGKSRENYGVDLMGLAIWLSHSRKDQAMPYLSYALKRWNEVKAAQKKSGQEKTFTNEYDATASAQDFPIHYGYISRLNPPIPTNQELSVAKYCYNAGNVNMYQANQIAQYYGVKSLPAVIVNGRPLANPTAANILAALK